LFYSTAAQNGAIILCHTVNINDVISLIKMPVISFDREKSIRVFFSIAAGTALTCSFDNISAGFAAWLGPMLLLAAIRNAGRQEAFFMGLLAGIVHYTSLVYWLVPTMHQYGMLPVWASVFAMLLLAFYLALYLGVFAWAVSVFAESPLSLLFAVPVFWVALEYAKTWLFSGFPWGLLGYSQYRHAWLIQSADIFGVYGISFFICAVSAAAFVLLIRFSGGSWKKSRPGRGAIVASVLVIVIVFSFNTLYGRCKIVGADKNACGGQKVRVSVIQGNIEQSVKWDEAYVQATIDKYIALSQAVVSGKPDLIVWPETALPFYFNYDEKSTRQILDAAENMGTYFLVGSPAYEYDSSEDRLSLFNSAYLIDPQGDESGRYDKVHLVPFGEYVPLKKWFPFLGKMVPGVSDFSPGKPGRLLLVNRLNLGVQICYEIIFPHLSASMTRAGANLLVNITNDAWFGKTSAPFQHFSMAVFRAVENRRPLVRAANTGISGFVDSAGRIMEASSVFETLALTEDLHLNKADLTIYTRFPHIMGWFCIGGAVLMLGADLRKVLRISRTS
jgi:apolipoprotein N-acyltransferase